MAGEGNRWAALAVTGAALILAMTTWFSATAVIPELVGAWSLSPSEASWLTSAVQLGFVVGALTSSLLSIPDIVPLPRLMALAALGAALANGALLLEPGYPLTLAARFLTGAALAGIYPPAMKFVSTWFRTGRGLALGIMVGALTLGSALPHLVRAGGAGLPWQVVVAVTSLASLVAVAIFGLALREGPYPFARATVDPRQIGAILRNRPVMLANLGYFGHMWELYAVWGWFLAYATAAKGGWSGNASLLAFALVALGAPGSILAGLMAERVGRCLTASTMMVISGSCAVLIGVAFDGPPALFLVVAVLWGLTVVSDSAQFSTAVTELAPPSQVGSALAFQMGTGFAITILSIWLVPILAEALGSWRWTFLVLVPGPVIGTLAMLALRRDPASAQLASGRG